ncbi:MAG TPA: hypothetical protein VL793_09055 [Patescibacteria group bacterium]|nr:hypothetical protein [Patescibacteria group bacterium]
MKTPLYACLTMALLLVACDEKSEKSSAGTNTANTAPATSQNAPGGYLGALQKGQQNAVKTVDTTSLDKAIQMFAVENGRNPKSLNELVEQKYIPKIPDAPYGTKLVYDPGSGTVKIVSQ